MMACMRIAWRVAVATTPREMRSCSATLHVALQRGTYSALRHSWKRCHRAIGTALPALASRPIARRLKSWHPWASAP